MEARKHAENTVKAGRFANVTNPCTAGKKAGTGKRTRWRAARARARPASLPWRNARHAFALPLEFLTEGAETMGNAIVSVLFAFPPQSVKTITCDRGAEFANWRRIEERLYCDIFFADPYCAWQKGTNEN